MKPQNTIYHLIAMVAAYGLVLAAPLLLDFLYDTHLEMMVITWCNVGLVVMLIKKIPYPTPDVSRIDVIGALKTLWWSVFWPNYLLRK